MKEFFSYISRLKFELIAILGILLLLILVPASYFDPQVTAFGGLLSLIITKFILVTGGIIHAHTTRKFLFPTIKFHSEQDWSNNVMIIAIYVVIIFGWTRGG